MAIIVANDNGDWWGWNKTEGEEMTTTLYVLDTDKITDPDTLNEIAEWAGVDLEIGEDGEYVVSSDIYEQINESLFDSDKLEKLAWNFGKEIEVKL